MGRSGIPALGRLRQEGQESEGSLSYIVKTCLEITRAEGQCVTFHSCEGHQETEVKKRTNVQARVYEEGGS